MNRRIIIHGSPNWPNSHHGWEALIGAVCNHLPPGGIMDPGTPPTPAAGTLVFAHGNSGIPAMMRDWGRGRDGDMVRMRGETHPNAVVMMSNTFTDEVDLVMLFPHGDSDPGTMFVLNTAIEMDLHCRVTELLDKGQWRTRKVNPVVREELNARYLP
jgi:hypothetical protein